jgi:uncharacterized protein (PEP-CTERM system associated)
VGIGLHVNLPYRRVRGFADYALTGTASHTDGTVYRHRNDLQAGLNAEIVESHAFLDLAATYGVQLGSVFESPARSLLVQNDNRLESATLTVSPSVRTRLGDGGRIEGRLTDSTTKVRGSDAGDIRSRGGTVVAESGVRPRSSTWKASASGAVYQPEVGRRTTEAYVRGDVGWAFDADTVVSVVGGREGNDFDTSRRVYNDLYGLNLDYRPNERTRFFAEALHRFFGTGHSLSLSYRLPQFALIASSNRTNSRPGLGLQASSAFSGGSAFDVLFLQLASVEPDPDRRRILVRDLLTANGIDPSQPVNPSLVTSGVLLVEGHSVSASWYGVRNSVTISLTEGNSRRLDSLVSLPLNDQFRTEDRIDQRGAQLIWLRRVTPADDFSVALGWSQADGSLTLLRSTSKSALVRWSRKIGTQSTLAVGVSHQLFDSSTASEYTVNIVSCEYRVRF